MGRAGKTSGTPKEINIEILANLILRVGKFNIVNELKVFLESENLVAAA